MIPFDVEKIETPPLLTPRQNRNYISIRPGSLSGSTALLRKQLFLPRDADDSLINDIDPESEDDSRIDQAKLEEYYEQLKTELQANGQRRLTDVGGEDGAGSFSYERQSSRS
jgi:hypothetical protein